MASESKADCVEEAVSMAVPAMKIVSSDETAKVAGGDASSTAATSDVFTFSVSPDPALPCLTDRDFKDNLKKWDLEQYRVTGKFRFGKRFEIDAANSFLLDFFNDPEVRSNLPVYATKRAASSIAGRVKAVDFQRLSTTVLNMDFFDKLQEAEIVTESGYIRKTYDNVVDGVTIADLLHDCLLNPESDHADVFSDEEKKEFLYELFKMVVTGGSMCQFDDNWQPYLDTVKTMYKQLLSVVKSESGKLSIPSVVFRVTGIDADTALFPNDLPHNYCFVIVDPLKRTVSVLYNAFVPFW